MNHGSNPGLRSNRSSICFIKRFAIEIPCRYLFLTLRTVGLTPLKVIVRDSPNAFWTELRISPRQWFSSTPHNRSTGLYLLWYGG